MDPTRLLPRLALLLALGLPAVARAGVFYRCEHPQAAPTFVNDEKDVARYRKEGFRCRPAYRTSGASGGRAEASAPSTAPSAASAAPAPSLGAQPKGREEERIRALLSLARDAAARYDIPVPFLLAVMKVESGFRADAVSEAGAQGLMQVMPFNHRMLGIRDPFDPAQSILGGARLLRILANRFEGDMVQVLAAYHAGGGAVDRKAGVPYEQTNLYVKKVLDYYYHFKSYYPAR